MKENRYLIYCVEDEESILDLVIYALHSSGFDAEGFHDSEALYKAVIIKKPDLILLDIMLPGDDGITALKYLKKLKLTCDTPVIMLTAKSAEYDKISGLDSGADDYITKPFGVMELISRIRAVLRRAGAGDGGSISSDNNGKSSNKDSSDRIGNIRDTTKSNIYDKREIVSAGDISIDNAKHEVTASGVFVKLTLKEYELLKYLIENAGIVFSRVKLLDEVWGYDFEGESRTVDVHIRTLRKKLGQSSDIIETIRGVGYRIGKAR